jgi:hypothetical protein
VRGSISTFTLSEWVYTSAWGTAGTGYSISAEFGGTTICTIDSNAKYRVVNGAYAASPNGFGSVTGSFWLGSWHLYTIVEDGATVYAYVDGALQASSPMATPGVSVTNPVLQIGSVFSGRDLVGLVDDVRIYNRALSAGEIAAMYNVHN